MKGATTWKGTLPSSKLLPASASPTCPSRTSGAPTRAPSGAVFGVFGVLGGFWGFWRFGGFLGVLAFLRVFGEMEWVFLKFLGNVFFEVVYEGVWLGF